MKWCEHIIGSVLEKSDWEFIYRNYHSTTAISANRWNFCPTCGTPRPKEETLADKFKKIVVRVQASPSGEWYWTFNSLDKLVEVAEKHFKEKSQ